MVINISIYDSVKKNNNAFELTIYVQKIFTSYDKKNSY